jgi:hypothetical protein
VVTLAEATGWSEEFILWALPLARGEQYLHAILVSHGANTRPTANALKELLEPEVV